MTDTVIRTKVDPVLNEAFNAFCKERDITSSQAIRAYMRKVVKIPNKETETMLNKSETGKDLYQAKGVDDLFDQLGI